MRTPAFPTEDHFHIGLTKREYAAIHIAAALISRGIVFTDNPDAAKRAVALADAVLREAGE